VCSATTAIHCSTGQGKLHSPLFSAACKTCSQLACVTAIAPEEICSSYRCAVTQQQCTAALGRANCIPRCSVLLFQIASQPTCVMAITAEEICSSYMCAVPQQQYTAALGRASCIPHCSVLLAKHAHSWLVSLQLHLRRFALHAMHCCAAHPINPCIQCMRYRWHAHRLPVMLCVTLLISD